ncbi:mitochondrial 54S ribosomal protein uL4m YML6 [Rhodotorula paludigena]|uniref:mitochondrial 54S ribosomal protein uL4m YML6 n=1 Tax=Rhodotorula paludigena TaxID=86838 RepID=UPI0031814CFB
MSFLAATRRVLRPSVFASSSRALATAVESLAPLAGSADAPAAPVASSSASPAATIDAAELASAVGSFVHVPLAPFYPASSPSATDAAPEAMVVPLPAPLFDTPSRPSLLHKIVTAHLSSLRAGTASTKNRSEVSFSGKKMRPQKGTGRARLGSRGSPMLKGGGRAFGPRPKGPEGWKRKINRKEEQLGLRVSLSEKWRSGNLVVVDKLGLAAPQTRVLNQQLTQRDWLDALFITSVGGEEQPRVAFELAAGNLPNVALVTDVRDMTVWDVLKRRKVVIELDAVDEVIERVDPFGPFVEEPWEDIEEDFEFDEADLAEAEALAEAYAVEAQEQPAEARV